MTDPDVAEAVALLDLRERERLEHLRFARDRRDYAAAHALLRTELSRYAGGAPEAWRFVQDARGKPAVADVPGAPALSFSLSHARGIVACAIAAGLPVGVDVEPIDRDVHDMEIARRFFSTDETARLARMAGEQERRTHFFELWTLKEAYAKAVGLGLAQPWSTIAFEVDAARRVRFVPTHADRSAWQFALCEAVRGTRLAVAVNIGSQIAFDIDSA